MRRKIVFEAHKDAALVASLGGKARGIDLVAVEHASGDERLLTEMVASTCRAEGESTVRVVVPRAQATVRVLHIPAKTQAEVESMVELQLARVIPHKKEDIVCGHLSAGKDAMGFQRIVVAVVLKDYLRQILGAMDAIGHAPDDVVLSSGEIWRAAAARNGAHTPKTELFAAVDIGETSSECIIGTTQHMMTSVSLPCGAATFRAEGIEPFVREWQQTVALFAAEESPEPIVRAYLSGIECEGFADAFGKGCGIEVVESQHVVYRDVADGKRHLLGARSFTSAVSASSQTAQPSLVFDVPEIAAKAAIVSRARQLTMLGMLLLYAVGVFSLGLLSSVRTKDARLRALQAENAEVERLTGTVMKDSARIVAAGDVIARRHRHVYALHELTAAVAGTAKVSYFGVDADGAYVLRGNVPDSSAVFGLVDRIERHPAFARAEIKFARRNKSAAGESTSFEIRCEAEEGGVR